MPVKDAEKTKRPQASPARVEGPPKIPTVKGDTPVKSPLLKKSKTEIMEGSQEKVNAYVDEMLTKSTSPMAPPYDISVEYIEREHPKPAELGSMFDAIAGEQPAEPPVPQQDANGMEVDSTGVGVT